MLGQQKVDEKSNEITAIPLLLAALDLTGCIVTIDAMGCQRDIAAQIDDQGGDYVLSFKGNRGQLHEDVQEMFAYFQKIDFADIEHDYHKTVDKGHGRIEIRECWFFSPHTCALTWEIDGRSEVEVAYMINKVFWGQGLATEAA